MFGSLLKAAVGVATSPVAIIADVVTLGGSLTDKRVPYTVEAAQDVVQNLKDATKPNK